MSTLEKCIRLINVNLMTECECNSINVTRLIDTNTNTNINTNIKTNDKTNSITNIIIINNINKISILFPV